MAMNQENYFYELFQLAIDIQDETGAKEANRKAREFGKNFCTKGVNKRDFVFLLSAIAGGMSSVLLDNAGWTSVENVLKVEMPAPSQAQARKIIKTFARFSDVKERLNAAKNHPLALEYVNLGHKQLGMTLGIIADIASGSIYSTWDFSDMLQSFIMGLSQA